MALRMRQALWGDGDLADAESHASGRAERKDLLHRQRADLMGDKDQKNVTAALELAESVAKAETERETNLNTRGATVAAVAGIIIPIATALANPLFTTEDKNWAGFPRNLAEYFFLAALVCVASAMAMAVVGVLRPGRGGRTKNTVGEAVVNVWRSDDGDIALAEASDRKIAVFRLDRLLRAIPTWHYRNRLKARWLRRAWMFLMIGIILIGSAGVIFLTELSDETIWEEAVAVIVGSLIVIWLLIRFDLVFAGRRNQAEDEAEDRRRRWARTQAAKEAKKTVDLLGPPSLNGQRPNKGQSRQARRTDNSR